MQRFVDLFAAFVVRFRWPIVIGVMLITFYFTYLLRYVTLPQEVADIAPKGHPYVELNHYMEKVFRTGALIEVALEVKQGDVFNLETIAKINRIGKQLYLMPQTIPGQVISIASRSRVKDTLTSYDEYGYPMVSIKGYHVLAERVINASDTATRETQMHDFKRKCLGNPAVYGRLISWDRKATVILITFFNEREFKEIFKRVNQIIEKEKDGKHNFYVAGRIYEMGYLHKYMGYMVYIFGAALAVTVLLLFAAFGTWRGIFIPLWAGYVAVAWGLGSEYLLGMKMDIMTIIVPFMIMAMEVSHCVQIISRFYEEYDKWGDNQKAAEETLKGLTIPSVASIVTDGAGFATLFFIPFALLQQMATSACFGVLRIFFTTTVFIHAFVAIIPPPTKKEMARIHGRDRIFKGIMAKVAHLSFSPKPRVAVLGVSFAMVLLTIVGTTYVVVGDLQEGSPLFWADSEYNIADKFVNQRFFGTSTYNVYIQGEKEKVEGPLTEPAVTKQVAALVAHLEDRPEVSGSLGYTDVLKAYNKAQHDADPRFFFLPKQRGMTYEYLLKFIEGGGPEDSQPYFEMDFGEGNIQFYVRDHKASTIHSIIDDTNEWIQKNHDGKAPAKLVQAGGVLGVFSAIMETIKKSQIESLWQISIVVLLFVLLTFRSIMAGLIVMVVLALGTLITFATMGFGEIGLFIYTVPVASLGMGLGVDYTLYIISRMLEEKRAGKSIEEMHHETLTNAGKAVFFTAMAIAMGVFVLLWSAIRFQAILGGMLAVVLTANMLGSIILLPALIHWWKPKFIYGNR
ncbi:MAG: MMPL family transporter [Nitrospinae bacterium]|nr:MMPL family transporter [Nitrospinota bacterium]